MIIYNRVYRNIIIWNYTFATLYDTINTCLYFIYTNLIQCSFEFFSCNLLVKCKLAKILKTNIDIRNTHMRTNVSGAFNYWNLIICKCIKFSSTYNKNC